ncbi:MAG: bifunctional precorrin-2 dehydrogenase/sirohydrochlorin ferrochelatase [Ruminococcaceae bacterium]|nr:bifunctional precorrin-2 dehydrogenase/sirohydrochlorin ferrochelatase [Oscillospiraceae bacterium]
MTHFPLFLDLKDKEILIFGGGEFALQRVKKLLPFSVRLRVISEQISEEIRQMENYETVILEERTFSENDLERFPPFVIIAEDEEKTAEIYEACKQRHIPVNAVDQPKYCDIIFPSVVSTEHLCIGISSGGISPTATVEFKERIERMIPENMDDILEWMGDLRIYINANLLKEKRKRALRKAFQKAVEMNRPLTSEELQNEIFEKVNDCLDSLFS